MQYKHNQLKINYLKANFIFLLLSFSACIQFRQSNVKIQEFFLNKSYQPIIKTYTALNREIRYLEIGNDSLPTVFFIHGSPSSSSVFNPYYTDTFLLKHVKMIGVDRPGYGYSGFGQAEPSLEQQVKMIKPILENPHLKRPIIVVGPSYGGPISAKLAMDYPHLVDGLIWVSPANAPGMEKIYNISYPIGWGLIRWAIPTMLKVANVEKLAHRAELEKLLPDWQKIRVPVSHFHGNEDELVYPENVNFSKKMLVNAPWLDVIRIPGGRHFLQWDYKDLIINQILKEIDYYQKQQKVKVEIKKLKP